MDKLEVEIEKYKKRVTKAVRKKLGANFPEDGVVSIEHHCFHIQNRTTLYVWSDSDIVAAMYWYQPCTIKELVQLVQTELQLRK